MEYLFPDSEEDEDLSKFGGMTTDIDEDVQLTEHARQQIELDMLYCIHFISNRLKIKLSFL